MRNRPGRKAIRSAAFLAAVAGLLLAQTVLPAAEKQRESTAKITVLAIHATKEKKPHCDKPLLRIRKALSRLGDYNCFRLLKSDTREVPYGKTWERPLVEDYSLKIKPESMTADKIKLLWLLVRYEKDKDGEKKETPKKRIPYSVVKGKWLLDGSWKLKKGALLLATRAE
jgi:hypothetical protein